MPFFISIHRFFNRLLYNYIMLIHTAGNGHIDMFFFTVSTVVLVSGDFFLLRLTILTNPIETKFIFYWTIFASCQRICKSKNRYFNLFSNSFTFIILTKMAWLKIQWDFLFLLSNLIYDKPIFMQTQNPTFSQKKKKIVNSAVFENHCISAQQIIDLCIRKQEKIPA